MLPTAALILPLLVSPGPLALGVEGPVALIESASEPASEAEPDSAPEPGTAEVAPAPEPSSGKRREWMLVIAPGFDYIRGSQNAYTARGGGFRLSVAPFGQSIRILLRTLI